MDCSLLSVTLVAIAKLAVHNDAMRREIERLCDTGCSKLLVDDVDFA